jgi:thiamine-phosphate pyrophosphorylase
MPSERAARLRGLYVLTPELEDTALLARRVEECLAGGASLVQYRAKAASKALALEQARRLAALCRASGVPFIVNDSVDLALACGADGVHLGRDDGDPRAARGAMPAGTIGVSCYGEPGRARLAAAAGADYVAVGSVFASRTKPRAALAPLELIGRMRRDSGLPVAAIGGIDASNAALAIDAGADMVAVISAVFDAPDVAAAARAIARRFESPASATAHARTQPRAL